MNRDLLTWLEQNDGLLWTLTAISAFTFLVSLFVIPLLISRLPADYFIRKPRHDRANCHPALRLFLVVSKNAVGLVLLLAGVAMLVLPGQGLLTILVAIMLLDFPGKRRLERWLIRCRPIRHAANWIRAKRNQPPLKLRKDEA